MLHAAALIAEAEAHAVAWSVRRWHASNPKNNYSLAQYGLDTDAFHRRFTPYSARLGIPSKAAGLARAGMSA